MKKLPQQSSSSLDALTMRENNVLLKDNVSKETSMTENVLSQEKPIQSEFTESAPNENDAVKSPPKIIVGEKEQVYSEEFAKTLDPLGKQIYSAMIKSGTEYNFSDEAALRDHILLEKKFREVLIATAKSDEEHCMFGAMVFTQSDKWQKVDSYNNNDEKTLNSNYAIGVAPDSTPSEAMKLLFTKSSYTTFDCSTMMMANVYKALMETVGEGAFDKLFEGDKKPDLVISPEFVYFKDQEKGTLNDHPIFESGMYEKTVISSMDELIPGDWVYFDNTMMYMMVKAGAWIGEHAAYTGKQGDEMMFKGFGMTELSYQKMLEHLSVATFQVDARELAIWKCLEICVPNASARPDLFVNLSNYEPELLKTKIEAEGGGFKITPSEKIISIVKQNEGIDLHTVVVSGDEFDPTKQIYSEQDILDRTLSGRLPGLSRDILRPRVDKMK